MPKDHLPEIDQETLKHERAWLKWCLRFTRDHPYRPLMHGEYQRRLMAIEKLASVSAWREAAKRVAAA